MTLRSLRALITPRDRIDAQGKATGEQISQLRERMACAKPSPESGRP